MEVASSLSPSPREPRAARGGREGRGSREEEPPGPSGLSATGSSFRGLPYFFCLKINFLALVCVVSSSCHTRREQRAAPE